MSLSTKETANKWGVSEVWVSVLCKQGRIAGATRDGWAWSIPEDAEIPTNKRTSRKKKSIYKTIDLFSGAGGLSYGFLQTGQFQLVAAAELNKNAQAT